jgi:hypothetical protein
MSRFASIAAALASLFGCTPPLPPLTVEPVRTDALYRFRQPQNRDEWAMVAEALGPGGHIVKLNAPDEGPSGYSDEYALSLGLVVHILTIEPRGDGPIYAQVEGVFSKPDKDVVLRADALTCNKSVRVGVHCTHGWDRTGYIIARERVLCEGWTPEAAHVEWHRHARYYPFGPRIPSPGLEEAWDEFVISVHRSAIDDNRNKR